MILDPLDGSPDTDQRALTRKNDSGEKLCAPKPSEHRRRSLLENLKQRSCTLRLERTEWTTTLGKDGSNLEK